MNSPSGLRSSEASLVRNLLQEAPDETVRLVLERTLVRIPCATLVAEAIFLRFLVTSRLAL